MPTNRRRIKLIQPRLQIRLILSFIGVSTLALLLQFMVFTSCLTDLAAELPQDGPLVLDRIPSYVLWTAFLSFAISLPLTFMVGVLVTFRVAGPVFRFERFLTEIIRGEKPEDCRLRKGDELQDLCGLLNRATSELRARGTSAETSAHSPARDVDRAA